MDSTTTVRSDGRRVFRDREEAGRLLAQRLRALGEDWTDALVLGLPRGGVPVAFEIAKEFELPLDVLVVRKLGLPGYEELAMGAIASGGVKFINRSVVTQFGIDDATIDAVAAREQRELARREQLYRGGRPPLRVADRTVILVDDGVATGATVRAAIELLRKLGAGRIVVAVPTAAPDTARILESEADSFVAVMTPEPFSGVGQWYQDFSQTTDHEVRHLLDTDEADPIP